MRFPRLVLMLICVLNVSACAKAEPDSTPVPPQSTEAATHAPPPTVSFDTLPPTALTQITVTAAPDMPPRQLLYYAAPSPDGRMLATVDDRGVQVHDAASFALLWRAPVKGMSEDVRDDQIHITWTADSQALNVVNTHIDFDLDQFIGYVTRFDAQTGGLLWHHGLQGLPYVTFAPDGNRFVAMARTFDAVEMWDATLQQQTGEIALHDDGIIASFFWPQSFSPNSRYVVATLGTMGAVATGPYPGSLTGENPTYDPALYVWDAVTGAQVAKLEHSEGVPALEPFFWTQDGTRIMSRATTRFIFWDTAAWEFRNEVYIDPKHNYAIPDLSPDGKWLLAQMRYITTNGPDGPREISRWNLSSLQELGVDPRLHADMEAGYYGISIGWLPDGHTLLIKVISDVYSLNMETGEITNSYLLPEQDQQVWLNGVYQWRMFQLSPDGTRIYALTPDRVVVYDAITGATLGEVRD